jgi:hypothetical protein
VSYLVWWKNYLKKESTWESKASLMKSVPELIKEYEKGKK